MNVICRYDSPLGRLTMATDGESLTGLWFDSQLDSDADLLKECQCTDLPIFVQTKEWLDIYFSGKDPGDIPPIKIITTPFRKRVCEIMLNIPYGETMTYGQIAKQIADEIGIEAMSAQAVGGAVGHNPISIIIPCHRVIGSDGSLTGYTGGLEIKTDLLKLEGAYEQAISKK